MMRRQPILLLLSALTGAACSSDQGATNQATNQGAPNSAPPAGSASVSATAGTTAPVTAGRTAVGASGTPGASAVGTAGRTATTAAAGSGAPVSAGSPAPVAGTGTTTSTAAAGSGNAGAMASSAGTSGGATPPDPGAAPMCMSKAPKEFMLNEKLGGGGTHKDSAHFSLFGSNDNDNILNFMEAAHTCFIEDWCFRTPGLSTKNDDSGPYYKTNIYSKAAMNAGGLTYWDMGSELAYITVLTGQASDPRTTVHEYGHAITMSEHNWIDQKRTGYWWETVANWVAYSFLGSPYCEDARNQFKIKPLTTIVDQMHTLQTVYNNSYTVICNDQNYYQAWPFLMYLTNNPDNYPGLGKLAIQDLMRKYQKGSNETPLHTLDRIAMPIKAQTIVGRYWARMAYMDIGFPVGQQDFLKTRGSLTFAANWDAAGGDMYTVKAARKPQYFGANITPLKVTGSGDVSVVVMNKGNGQMDSNFSATLAIHSMDNATRYVDLPMGMGQAKVAANEEVSLVVVNTPDKLYQFDPQYIASPENVGLNYQVQLTGAAPSN